MTRNIVIVGAGIVGTLLARELATGPDVRVTVLERAATGGLPGSTGHAPGFIGVYNEDEAHVPLAIRSAEMYAPFTASFAPVGGLDIADTEEGAEQLLQRMRRANANGLDVSEIAVEEAARLAPAIVDPGRAIFALHSPRDGAVLAARLVADIRAAAVERGARFVYDAEVAGIERHGAGWSVAAGDERLRADEVVLAGGLWGGALAALVGVDLPLVPVGHPYIYSAPQNTQADGPLVRFREHAVYARVHGDRIGMGCYAHDPFDASRGVVGASAELEWQPELFDPVVEREISLLPAAARFAPQQRLNGLFSMTPDGLPYIGPLAQTPGIWVAQAIWVTHAGGAAHELAEMMRTGAGDGGVFAPDRFAGQDRTELHRRALALY